MPDTPFERRREADAYISLGQQLDSLYQNAAPYHQLLGYPHQIQGDLLQECQQDTRWKGDPTDWQLLLKIDSDDDTGVMWGDVGMLYFYIPQQALAERDFSQVHLIMQCSQTQLVSHSIYRRNHTKSTLSVHSVLSIRVLR